MQGVFATHRLSSEGLSRPQRLVIMAGAGFLLAYLLSWLGIVETLELVTYDLRFRLRGSRPADVPIVIVAINDESFNVLKQNLRTWPRADYARLIDTIAAGGPAVIGVDVAWTHAGANAGDDEALARSLERAAPVLPVLNLTVEIRPHRTLGCAHR